MDMLRNFAEIAGVATVPALEEWSVNADKVALHEMKRAHRARCGRGGLKISWSRKLN